VNSTRLLKKAENARILDDGKETRESAYAFSVLWDTGNRIIKYPTRIIIRK
jgi:hypothetical protein